MGIIDSLSKPTTYEKEVDLNKIKENLKESVIGMVDSIVCLEQAEMFKKLITPIPFTLSAITTKTSNNDFRKPASCINTPHNKKITPQRLFSTKKKRKVNAKLVRLSNDNTEKIALGCLLQPQNNDLLDKL